MATVLGSNMSAMDDATAQLILQIQMEELEHFENSLKGKGRVDEKTDADFAIELYKKELDHNAAFISDRLMSKSIAHAVQTDGQLLLGAFEKEDLRARDHAIALSGEIPDAPTKLEESSLGEAQIMNDEVLEKLAAKYMGCDDAYLPGCDILSIAQKECIKEGESSAWAATRQLLSSTKDNGRAVIERTCVSCDDKVKFFDLARVPCGHEYCGACLRELFRLAMSDESLFPPRCCRQHITLGIVRMWLDTNLAVAFYKKKIELDTPNRTYCSNKACSGFIHMQNIANDIATCASCSTRTCTMCKGPVHQGDCPNDTALQQVLEVAEANRWKRCYSCSQVVELVMGCNHITCRCGAHFCYICGQKWYTCACPTWDEDRLLGRANVIVDRAARQVRAVIQPAQNVVPAIRARLAAGAAALGRPAPPALARPAPPVLARPAPPAATVVPVALVKPAPPHKQHVASGLFASPAVKPHVPIVIPMSLGTSAGGSAQNLTQTNMTQNHGSSSAEAKVLTPSHPLALTKAISGQSSSSQPASSSNTAVSPSILQTLKLHQKATPDDKKKVNILSSTAVKVSSQLATRTQPVAARPELPRAQLSFGLVPTPLSQNASVIKQFDTRSASSSSKQISTRRPSLVGKWTIENAMTNPANKFMRQVENDKEDVAGKSSDRPDRAKLIADAIRRLRLNHECEHQKWKYVSGTHHCEECHQWLRQYIFECRQCEVQACNRCRRNRL